jgi:hypothetical protein
MSPILANELEILSFGCRAVLEDLIVACLESRGNLHDAEAAMETAMSSLRSIVVSGATRVCVSSADRDYYCPHCQLALTRWGLTLRHIVTTSGEGRFPSERYYCRRCKTGYYPWQTAHGLDGKNQFTLAARQLIAEEAAKGPFEEASGRLKRRGINVSPSEVDSIAREVGTWRKHEQDAVRALSCQSGQVLPLPLHDWSVWPENPFDEDVVVFSVDGAHVRSNEAGPNGLEWFEVRTGIIRLAGTDQHKSRKLCVAGIMDADKLFETLRSQWWQAPAPWTGRRHRMVFIADGAEWIWNRARWHFPHCVQILDAYHCAEHVASAARAAWGPDSKHAQTWINGALLWLLEERGPQTIIRNLIDVLRTGNAVQPDDLRTELRYLLRHRHRMHYHKWRSEGLPIGSGAVESTIKQITTQRMRQAGMMWTKPNADLMMHLRAAVLSNSLHLTVERERRIRANRAVKFRANTYNLRLAA